MRSPYKLAVASCGSERYVIFFILKNCLPSPKAHVRRSLRIYTHLAHCGIFENGVLLMYTLEGESSVANFITAEEKF